MIRLLIAGSRTVDQTFDEIDAALLRAEIDPADIAELISGHAKGADLAGERWARKRCIPVMACDVTRAEYSAYGPYVAPKMRNRRIAEIADVALAFWDGLSGGTTDMVTRMVVREKRSIVVPTKRAASTQGELPLTDGAIQHHGRSPGRGG